MVTPLFKVTYSMVMRLFFENSECPMPAPEGAGTGKGREMKGTQSYFCPSMSGTIWAYFFSISGVLW